MLVQHIGQAGAVYQPWAGVPGGVIQMGWGSAAGVNVAQGVWAKVV